MFFLVSFVAFLITEGNGAAQPDGGSPAPGAAGSGGGIDDSIPLTGGRRQSEVNVVFTVTDERGRYLKGMTQSDFTVIDNSKPAKHLSLSRQTNLPLRVGLLIDASNWDRDRLKSEAGGGDIVWELSDHPAAL